jgi:hypothetical protein
MLKVYKAINGLITLWHEVYRFVNDSLIVFM